jgi:hypothetical protein
LWWDFCRSYQYDDNGRAIAVFVSSIASADCINLKINAESTEHKWVDEDDVLKHDFVHCRKEALQDAFRARGDSGGSGDSGGGDSGGCGADAGGGGGVSIGNGEKGGGNGGHGSVGDADGSGDATPELPPPWMLCTRKATGQQYYFHPQTNERRFLGGAELVASENEQAGCVVGPLKPVVDPGPQLHVRLANGDGTCISFALSGLRTARAPTES